MTITLQELCSGRTPQNEMDLAKLSDKIWKFETLAEIREKVSPEVFLIFVGINTIGNWKGDGWGGILENPEFIPHIAGAMNALGLPEVGSAFQRVVDTFPPHTVFADSSDYCDTLNFLSNPSFRINDERLNQYSPDERKQMSSIFNEALNILDELVEPLWVYDAPDAEGWGIVLGYIGKQLENPI